MFTRNLLSDARCFGLPSPESRLYICTKKQMKLTVLSMLDFGRLYFFCSSLSNILLTVRFEVALNAGSSQKQVDKAYAER